MLNLYIGFRSQEDTEMMKAVAVLSGSEGVSGTVYFTQEGDGNLICFFRSNRSDGKVRACLFNF